MRHVTLDLDAVLGDDKSSVIKTNDIFAALKKIEMNATIL